MIRPERLLCALWLCSGMALAQSAAPKPMAEVGISPPYMDIDFTQAQKTQNFRFHNLSSDPKRVRVSVVPWDLQPDGTVVITEPAEDGIDQWVVVNPSSFSTPAGQTQVIRFSVRPAVKLADGEHRFLLILDEADPTPEEAAQSEQREGVLEASFRLQSAVYVQVGEVHRTATVGNLRPDASGVSLQLNSTGTANARFLGQYALYPKAQYPGKAQTRELPGLQRADFVKPEHALWVGNLPSSPVLPGRSRTLRLELPVHVPAGEYVLDLNGQLGSEPLDEAFDIQMSAASSGGGAR